MSQLARDENVTFHTDMPVGEILRRTRQHYGQSLYDIERALRIKAEQIEAIETGHAENLPGRVYAIGFVRTYAEHLGLDGAKIVQLFKAQQGQKAGDPELHFPVAANDTKVPGPAIITVSLLCFCAVLYFWWASSQTGRTNLEVVPDPPEVADTRPDASDINVAGNIDDVVDDVVDDVAMDNVAPVDGSQISAAESTQGPFLPSDSPVNNPREPASALTEDPAPDASSVTASEQAQTASASAQRDIILNIQQNTWVQIRDESDQVLVSRVLEAGERYYVPDRPDLYITLGNAGGVDIQIGERQLNPLGQPGDVKRDIPLQISYLSREFGFTAQGPSAEE